jgi:hypothetical protein
MQAYRAYKARKIDRSVALALSNDAVTKKKLERDRRIMAA